MSLACEQFRVATVVVGRRRLWLGEVEPNDDGSNSVTVVVLHRAREGNIPIDAIQPGMVLELEWDHKSDDPTESELQSWKQIGWFDISELDLDEEEEEDDSE